MIGVKEGELQPPGELSPDGGFAGAGQADEGDQWSGHQSQGWLQRKGISLHYRRGGHLNADLITCYTLLQIQS